jgi:hypothetical protein
MNLCRSGGLLSLLAGMLLLPACSDSLEKHPPVYPVNGQVLVNGKPLVAGVVVFESESPVESAPGGQKAQPLRATGKIENDGKFTMRAYPGEDGLPEGKYKVSVTARAGRSESNLFNKAELTIVKGKSDVVKGKYADLKTSGLHAQVYADKPNEPVFELK